MRPLARFGQNFLHDQNIVRAIVDDAVEGLGDLSEPTQILEIGPGLGALSGEILSRKLPLAAIEIDRGLAAFLREQFKDEPHFLLVEGDALDLLPTAGAAISPRLILGNLPYNISTPLLALALALPEPPQRLVLMLQREVAERLAARHDTPDYGALSILVQVGYAVRIVRKLSPSVFYPAPEVESAVVRFDRLAVPLLPEKEEGLFHDFVKKGFSQRRKKLSNTLGQYLEGEVATKRPGELSVGEWVALWKARRQT